MTIVAPGPSGSGSQFAPGIYPFAAAQQDQAGNVSGLSPSVSITIATTGTTPTVVLDPASESGAPGSNITNVNGSNGVFPKFDVSNVVAGATLNLLRNGVIVNTITNAAGGTVVISDQGTSVLPDGIYQYMVQQIDNVGNRYGDYPITEAVKLGDVDLVRTLLGAGADGDSPDQDGQTALMLAASLGLAMAVGFAPPALFEAVAPSVRVLAADGIVVGTVMAVVLNLVLPNKD